MCFNLRHLFFIRLVKIPSVQCLDFFSTPRHFSLTILWVWEILQVPIHWMYKSLKKNTNWQLCPITPHHSPGRRAKFSGEIILHVHKTALSQQQKEKRRPVQIFAKLPLLPCASSRVCFICLSSSPSIKGKNM